MTRALSKPSELKRDVLHTVETSETGGAGETGGATGISEVVVWVGGGVVVEVFFFGSVVVSGVFGEAVSVGALCGGGMGVVSCLEELNTKYTPVTTSVPRPKIIKMDFCIPLNYITK